ncbi:deferrochelatase/peroxidase EfeB, partial [Streptomyces scabiei]
MADQSIPEARNHGATRAKSGGKPGGDTGPTGPLGSESTGTAKNAEITTAAGGSSRRRLLGTAGATGLVLGAAGAAAGYAAAPSSAATPLTSLGSEQAMFHGKHQPGIITPLQARGHLIAFDLA